MSVFYDVLAYLGSIVIALASISGLLVFLVKKFGDAWATNLALNAKAVLDEEIETHKVRLKKSEFIFQKEYEAASELTALLRFILPNHKFPDMDWYEACDDIARNFDNIEKKLDSFLARHGVILTQEVSDIISSAKAISSSENFFDVREGVPESSNVAANNVYEKVSSAEAKMREQVLGQVSM